MQNADVGNVSTEGGASFHDGNLHIQGSGQGIVEAGDSFHYVWQANRGNFIVSAKISPGSGAEGALAIRETDNPTSAGIWLGFNSSGKINVILRAATNAAPTKREFDAGGSEPIWLKVVRRGNTFDCSSSEDGTAWSSFHQEALTLPERSIAGFGISGTNAEAVFEKASVVGESQLSEIDADNTGGGGGSDGGSSEAGSNLENTSSSTESSGTNSQNESSPTTARPATATGGLRKLYVNKLLGNDNFDGKASLRSGNAGPKKSIQAALALAKDGDEIVVAPGTYKLSELNPVGNIAITPSGEVILEP